MKELKLVGILPTTKYYLVIVNTVSINTNTINDKIIIKIRQLLNERFMHISKHLPSS